MRNGAGTPRRAAAARASTAAVFPVFSYRGGRCGPAVTGAVQPPLPAAGLSIRLRPGLSRRRSSACAAARPGAPAGHRTRRARLRRRSRRPSAAAGCAGPTARRRPSGSRAQGRPGHSAIAGRPWMFPSGRPDSHWGIPEGLIPSRRDIKTSRRSNRSPRSSRAIPALSPGGARVPNSRTTATWTSPPGGGRAAPMPRSGRIRAGLAAVSVANYGTRVQGGLPRISWTIVRARLPRPWRAGRRKRQAAQLRQRSRRRRIDRRLCPRAISAQWRASR
jgi:hypothetical protein